MGHLGERVMKSPASKAPALAPLLLPSQSWEALGSIVSGRSVPVHTPPSFGAHLSLHTRAGLLNAPSLGRRGQRRADSVSEESPPAAAP